MGVSFASSVLNAQFAEQEELPYALWSDGERELGLHYGAAQFPSDFFAQRITVVLDAAGQWVLTHAGFGDVGAHPSNVLEDCKKLF